MMYALAYIDPETQDRYFCSSIGHRSFHAASFDPTLYASPDNIKKALRAWKKYDKTSGYPSHMELFNATSNIRSIWPIPYKDLHIVSIELVPDFNSTEDCSKI